MNDLDSKELNDNDVPFFAWQCLTLQLKHRDVDLVIKNEREMDDFIKVLVEQLNTADNSKESALAVQQRIEELK